MEAGKVTLVQWVITATEWILGLAVAGCGVLCVAYLMIMIRYSKGPGQ